jgi:hypothetical protein
MPLARDLGGFMQRAAAHPNWTAICTIALLVFSLACGADKPSSGPSGSAASARSRGGGALGATQISIGLAHNPGWVTHVGGPGDDEAFAVRASAAGVFVAGETSSDLFDTFDDPCKATGEHEGEDCADAFVMNADTGMGVQFGGRQQDSARSVLADRHSVYVAGKSREPRSANYQNDGWVMAFSADLGRKQWELPIANPKEVDEVLALAYSQGLFVCGGSSAQLTPAAPSPNTDENMFVMSIDPGGARLAVNQFGSKEFEELMGIAAEAQGVYVVGQTGGYLDDDPAGANRGRSTDALLVVMHRTLKPNLEVCRVQFGTKGKDVAQAIAEAGDYLYIAGWTEGTMNGEITNGATCNQDDSLPRDDFRADVFVAKYDKLCNHVWTRQFGSKGGDFADAIAADGQYVYVVGSHGGGGDHEDTSGTTDAFLRVYDAQGEVTGEIVFASGAGLNVRARAVAVDEKFVYVAGATEGDLGPKKSNLGGADAFVAKIPLAKARANVSFSGAGCP